MTIENDSELHSFLSKISSAETLAIDTEFVREKFYYPKLCLIQISDGVNTAVIDTIKIENLEPLKPIFANENIVKAIHSCRQDIEVIHNAIGIVPYPIFDTQVAAMFLGYGESVSYASLAESLLGEQVDKSSQYTDWMQRPLSQKQMEYAAREVTLLYKIHKILSDKLGSSEKFKWMSEEMEEIKNFKPDYGSPEDAWKKAKIDNKAKVNHKVLQEVAKWREIEAMRRNLPRKRIIADELVCEIASKKPNDIDALKSTTRLTEKQIKSFGKQIIDAVQTGLVSEKTFVYVPPKPALPASDLLKALLKQIAINHKIPASIIANSSEIDSFAQDSTQRYLVKFMKGWRFELFGKYALSVIEGKSSLKISDGNIAISDCAGE